MDDVEKSYASAAAAAPSYWAKKVAAQKTKAAHTFGHSPKAVRRAKAETAKAPKSKMAASPLKTATAAPEAKSPGAKLAAGGSGSHPPYLEMIVAAVESLKEHNGSSRQAILQYITSHHVFGVLKEKLTFSLLLREGRQRSC